jgi:hypothetical protein
MRRRSSASGNAAFAAAISLRFVATISSSIEGIFESNP